MSRRQVAVCCSQKATSSKVNGAVGYRNWKWKMDVVARLCGGWDGRCAYVCFKFSIFTIFPAGTNIGHLKLPIVEREHFLWTIIFLGPMVKSSECTRYFWGAAIITFLSTSPKSASMWSEDLTCKHKRPSYRIERHWTLHVFVPIMIFQTNSDFISFQNVSQFFFKKEFVENPPP